MFDINIILNICLTFLKIKKFISTNIIIRKITSSELGLSNYEFDSILSMKNR